MSLLLVRVLRFSLLISAYCDIVQQIRESQNNNKPTFRPNPGLTLMDQMREVLRPHGYVYRTEQASTHSILCYL
jgi:hypothetical protein